jgi:hypothetical protein
MSGLPCELQVGSLHLLSRQGDLQLVRQIDVAGIRRGSLYFELHPLDRASERVAHPARVSGHGEPVPAA